MIAVVAVVGLTVGAAATTTVAHGSHDAPRRVVVVGDSLVVGTQDQLSATFAEHGVEARFIAAKGTGLLSDQGGQGHELKDMLDEFPADVVVIESCCNYDGTYRGSDGYLVDQDTRDLWDTWDRAARRMVDTAHEHGANVAFVITPRVVDDTWFSGLQDRIDHFNDIYRSLDVRLIDWDHALYPEDTTDGREDLRLPDGLHLTPAGGDVIAAATWKAISGAG